MLLSELIGVKKFYSMTLDDILSFLEKEHDVQIIGRGNHGTVISKNDWDYVIKLWSGDDCFSEYINFVSKNNNIHYPKIVKKIVTLPKFFKRVKSYDTHFSIVKLEKLYPLEKGIVKCIVDLFSRGGEISIVNQDYVESQYLPFRTFPDGTSKKASKEELIKAAPWLPSLSQAWIDIYTKLETKNCGLDVHDHNFMKRKDGTIVVIDPLWVSPSLYQLADAQYKTEIDYYSDYEPEYTEGPFYLQKKNEIERVIKDLTFSEIEDFNYF